MLGAPFGAGAAHIVQFRPIGDEQRIRQRAEQAGNVGGRTPRPTAMDECSGRGANRMTLSARRLPSPVLPLLIGEPTRQRRSTSLP